MKEILDNVTVSVSTIMLLQGIKYYAGDMLISLALPMMLVGAVILVLGKRLIKDFEFSITKRILTNSAGLAILLTGTEYFLQNFIGKYAWIYIIIALIIFHYRNELTAEVY